MGYLKYAAMAEEDRRHYDDPTDGLSIMAGILWNLLVIALFLALVLFVILPYEAFKALRDRRRRAYHRPNKREVWRGY